MSAGDDTVRRRLTTLNDSEIRSELRSRGVQVGPVDSSTRELWRRRLRKVLEKRQSDFSSDEEPDTTSKQTHRTGNGKCSNGTATVQNSTIRRRFFSQRSISFATVCIPRVLLGGVCVFFVSLTIFYVATISRNAINSPSEDNTVYFECSTKKNPCWEGDEFTMCIEYIQGIWTNSSKAKGRHECGHLATNDTCYIPLDQLGTESVRLCIAKHILANSHWNLSLLDSSKKPINDGSFASFVVSMVAVKSRSCLYREALCNWANANRHYLLAILTVLMLYAAVKYFLRRRALKKEFDRRSLQLVEEILDVLKTNHLHSTQAAPYMAMNHVRDMLLPPTRRTRLELGLWDTAVRFISEHESRVRVEEQRIEGEDFLVWRWLQPKALAVTNALQSRGWKGQAFDTSREKFDPPSNCLKIRYMFDPDSETDPDWQTAIRDAIFEKCIDIYAILDIQIDANSKDGVVYMKCNDRQAAHMTYKRLHGWWYLTKDIVSVRFITEERYHQRFPSAVHTKMPLKPSYSGASNPVPFDPSTDSIYTKRP